MLASVIVPIFNVEKYLRESLDSIKNQTLSDLEIICVDDGSTDGCGAILDEYVERDKRFRAIRQENAGLSAARNVGLDVATGRYVFFLDSDDFAAPTLCEKALAVAEKTDADATIFGGWEVAEDGQTVVRERNPHDFFEREIVDDPMKRLSCNFHFWGATVWKYCWKRSFLEENAFRFLPRQTCEDVPFSSPAVVLANRVAVCFESLYYYRLRDGSLMRNLNSEVYRGGGVRAYNAALETFERRFSIGSPADARFAANARRFLLQQKIKFVASMDALPFSGDALARFEQGVRDGLVDGELTEALEGTLEFCPRRRRLLKNARAFYASIGERSTRQTVAALRRRIRRTLKNARLNVFFKKWIDALKRVFASKKRFDRQRTDSRSRSENG